MHSHLSSSASLPESVLIFGCGYVGTALAQSLLRDGVRVGALTRNAEKAASLRLLGVGEVIEGDLDCPSWHEQVRESYRAVVNCVSSAGGGLAGYEKSYYEGQRSILQWLDGKTIDRFVYTSSTSVYPQDGGVVVDETADTTGAPQTAQVLLRSEQLIEDAAHLFSRWYVLRLAGIYGPARHYLLDTLREGREFIPGSGEHHLNLIHLEDIISALRSALRGGPGSGVYNLCDDSPARKKELVEWLASRIGASVPQFEPGLATERLQRRGGQMPDRIVLNEKLREAFDWRPVYVDFRKGYESILSS
ncbi:MAG: NAD-dependent epimerase/dehydratase family protein [Coraliomargaritaceae bacterium]